MKYNKKYDEPSDEWRARVNEFLNESHEHLYKVEKNLGNNCHDLVGELVIYLYQNEKKLKSHTNLEAFSVRWMANKDRWQPDSSNAVDNYLYSNANFFETSEYACKSRTVKNKFSVMETHAQPDPDVTEEEYDLHSVFSETQVDKIMAVKNIVDRLSKEEQILFKLYFEQNTGSVTLSRHLKIPRTSVWKMVSSMITKIRNEYDIDKANSGRMGCSGRV